MTTIATVRPSPSFGIHEDSPSPLIPQVCFMTTIVIVRPSLRFGIHEDSHSPLILQVNPTFDMTTSQACFPPSFEGPS